VESVRAIALPDLIWAKGPIEQGVTEISTNAQALRALIVQTFRSRPGTPSAEVTHDPLMCVNAWPAPVIFLKLLIAGSGQQQPAIPCAEPWLRWVFAA
jgi:hypothetical protein